MGMVGMCDVARVNMLNGERSRPVNTRPPPPPPPSACLVRPNANHLRCVSVRSCGERVWRRNSVLGVQIEGLAK